MNRSLSLPHAPLDIFLQRSHGLPLPYLASPALSFLTYLSPLAYLSILRTTPSPSPPLPSGNNLPKLDIPLTYLRERLATHPRPKGTTVATLSISESKPHESKTLSSIEVEAEDTERPTFPFAQPGISHTFPQLPTSHQNTSSGESFEWILDFTSSGPYRGVIMSQSRMREIEYVLDPSLSTDVGIMGFGGEEGLSNWVNLLVRLSPSIAVGEKLIMSREQLDPTKSVSHSAPSIERYTALYVSAFVYLLRQTFQQS